MILKYKNHFPLYLKFIDYILQYIDVTIVYTVYF